MGDLVMRAAAARRFAQDIVAPLHRPLTALHCAATILSPRARTSGLALTTTEVIGGDRAAIIAAAETPVARGGTGAALGHGVAAFAFSATTGARAATSRSTTGASTGTSATTASSSGRFRAIRSSLRNPVIARSNPAILEFVRPTSTFDCSPNASCIKSRIKW